MFAPLQLRCPRRFLDADETLCEVQLCELPVHSVVWKSVFLDGCTPESNEIIMNSPHIFHQSCHILSWKTGLSWTKPFTWSHDFYLHPSLGSLFFTPNIVCGNVRYISPKLVSYGGRLKWGVPPDGFQGKIPLKWMMTRGIVLHVNVRSENIFGSWQSLLACFAAI